MTPHLTWTEIKLLAREPLTLLMSLLFPVVLMVLLAGSFGNEADVDFGGVGGVDFYVPIYAAATVVAMGFLGLPVHLAGYRENGVLRRYRSAGIPSSSVLVAFGVVTAVVAVVGTAVMLGIGFGFYDLSRPESPPGVAAGVAVGTAACVAMGAFLGSLLPTSRAAQGLGFTLFFGLFFIAGGGPPPAILPDAINTFIGYTPMGPLVDAYTTPWHVGGVDGGALVALAAVAVVAGVLAVMRLSRD